MKPPSNAGLPKLSKKEQQKERDEQFAAQLPSVLAYHHKMLADPIRNKLLFRAIKKVVRPDTSFLDIGAGTGVWAILAAKLGAKKVTAVEAEETLIPLIFQHARENGVADRIEIVHGNSRDVRLQGRYEVIVSELFGGNAFGEETVEAFVDIRKRFLAPGGKIIPQKLEILAAPARVKRSIRDVPASLPISTNFLADLKLNFGSPLSILERGDVELLAEPATIAEIDFRTTVSVPELSGLTAVWKLSNIRKVNAIASFSRSTFSDGIVMDSFASQSWGASVNEFVPFQVGKGELIYTASIDKKIAGWSVSVPGQITQNYSPVFAFARTKMAQAATPHRVFRPKKSKA